MLVLQNCCFEDGHLQGFVVKQTDGLTFSGSSIRFQSIHGMSEGFIAQSFKARHRVAVRGKRSSAVNCKARLYGVSITRSTEEHIRKI